MTAHRPRAHRRRARLTVVAAALLAGAAALPSQAAQPGPESRPGPGA